MTDAPYVERLVERLDAAAAHGGPWPSLARTARSTLAGMGDRRLSFGRWHGDWVPWNLAWHDGRAYALDWEHAGDGVPIGFDLVHYRFASAFFAERRSVRSATSGFHAAREELRALGPRGRDASLVAWLYLVEIALRALAPVEAGATPNERLFPEIARVADEHAAEVVR